MDNTAIDVLKWIGVVLAAGFIGYFGRYLAMMLIERTRRKRSEQTATGEPYGETPASPEAKLGEMKLKVEKKRAKAGAKKVKKGQRRRG